MKNIQTLVARATAQDETLQRLIRFLSKTHPLPLFSVGGMKLSAVDHGLIKSSNTNKKPLIQKCSEKSACRSQRRVTKW